MCRRFEDRLNEDIKVFVGILELKEFVVLVDRACKAEELIKEKRKVEAEDRNLKKRSMSSTFPPQSRKPRDMYSRSHVSPNIRMGIVRSKMQVLNLRLLLWLVWEIRDLLSLSASGVAEIILAHVERMNVFGVVLWIILLETPQREVRKKIFKM